MALTTDRLSVWDIGFRWSDLDPDALWLRLPLPAKDNFRVLMDSILNGEILCDTLTLAKRPATSKADPRYYVRTYIDDIHNCIYGHKYNRKLLKWAVINRMGFYEWCDARGIPHPEFWFPPGWKLHYEMSEGGSIARWAEHIEPDTEGGFHVSYASAPQTIRDIDEDDLPLPDSKTSRASQLIRITCQQIAQEIWKKETDRTITSVVTDPLIQEYGGANYYNKDTVRGWIKVVAPPEVRSRRGRPRKNRD